MIRSALLAALFALTLTACGEKPAEEAPPAVEEMTEEAPAAVESLEITGDESPTTEDLPTAAEEMTEEAPAAE